MEWKRARWRRIDIVFRELLQSLRGMSALNISSWDLLSTYNVVHVGDVVTMSDVPEFCGRRLLKVVDHDGNGSKCLRKFTSAPAHHTDEQNQHNLHNQHGSAADRVVGQPIPGHAQDRIAFVAFVIMTPTRLARATIVRVFSNH